MQIGKNGKFGQRDRTLEEWLLIRGIELTPEDYQSLKNIVLLALENVLFEEGTKLKKIDLIKEIFTSRFFGK